VKNEAVDLLHRNPSAGRNAGHDKTGLAGQNRKNRNPGPTKYRNNRKKGYARA
jgi:hypothetical protein